MYRFIPSHWSIITKLIVMSVLLLLAVGGIVAVNLLAYRYIEGLLITTLNKDITQIINNAKVGREFSKVFAETNVLVNTFTEREKTLKTDSEKLIAILHRNISDLQHEEVHVGNTLREFTAKLQSLLNQCLIINEILGNLRKIDSEFDKGLEILDDTVASKELSIVVEGSEEEITAIRQLSSMLSGYKEVYFQVTIKFINSKQAHLGTRTVKENYEQQILLLLEEFYTSLEATTTAWKDIEPLIKQLMEIILQYKEHITILHKGMREFQIRHEALENAQVHVMNVMEEIERKISQSTENIQGEIAPIIQSSATMTMSLSGVIIFVLVIVGAYTVKMIRPIKDLAATANRLAEGDIHSDIREVKSHDEIGILSNAFKHLITYFREMAHVATEISQGNLSNTIQPKSQHDILGHAFLNMSAYLNEMAAAATAIAKGNIYRNIQVKTEHDVLGRAFEHMIGYIEEAAEVAQKISVGDIHQLKVTPKSERDVFNRYFAETIRYVQEATDVAEKIANKRLDINVTPKSEQDVLNNSLQRMVANLRMMMDEIERRNWLKTGQADLNNLMRGEQQPANLAQNIITYLATYLQAQVGTIYLADKQGNLQLAGSYAYSTLKGNCNKIPPGEGLVGQAALEKRRILFTDIPDEYISISSSLGKSAPRNILIAPFLYAGNVKGIVELGTVHEFTDIQQDFFDQVSENVAIALHTAQTRTRMNELLKQTQHQSEELQLQQEELRQKNEELQVQARTLKASQEQLIIEQEKLQQTNEELEERTLALQQQKKELAKKHKEVEKARQLLEEKASDLELANKYKSEFLANMSHELRTPLNSLLILSRMLYENRNGNLSEKQIEFARTIYTSGSELLELINEILDLSKVEAGKLVIHVDYTELSQLSEYIERNFHHVAEEKKLYLTIRVNDTLPEYIRTDAQRVEQIVKNFLSNSLKFTEQGGITVRFDRPALNINLSHSGLNPQHTLAVSVSDTGIGIPEDKLRAIFEAFQQADGSMTRKYGGTGLGLSISRELAALLGGEIQVQSEEGKGSTFTLYLPEILQQESPVETFVTAQPTREFAIDTASFRYPLEKEEISIDAIYDDRRNITSIDKTLLIIEDDPNFAKILRDHAHQREFKCFIAGDGAAGLQLAFQYKPKAVILDIGLPDMDGWTVMKRLKEHNDTRSIPIHVISVHDPPLEAMKMGAIGYLTKPVSLEDIENTFKIIEDALSKPIKSLLMVEDNEEMKASIRDLIDSDAVAITAAETGQEAYALLKAEHFDCMVLDLGLADVSAIELLDQIKNDETVSHIPIVIYTGQDLTKEEDLLLGKYSKSIIIKSAKSRERLLDELTLFLHHIEKHLPKTQQKKLRMLHDKEEVFEGKSILLVDDDVRNVFALTSMLEEKGLNVLMSENGKEALELLNDNPDIDLVLMDMMMPEMDGYETMKAIRSQPAFKKLSIIALTAKAMKGDRQKCLDFGANDYLAKPIDIEKLLSLLRVWLY